LNRTQPENDYFFTLERLIMIKPLKKISIAVAITSSCFYCPAYAQESSSPDLTMGFNYSVNFQAYKGHKTYQTILPVFFL